LALCGNDDDFNETIIKVVEAFASYGHSGGSASVAIPMINDLLQFKNLTPLTDNPLEWNEVGPGMWQSSRNSEAFSDDRGKTYTLISETVPESAPIHNSNPYTKNGINHAD
jgi:hypothetical protein